MPKRYRPGPKSRTRIYSKAGDLGEEDPALCPSDPNISSDRIEGSFRTPTTDDDATDYELEYTSQRTHGYTVRDEHVAPRAGPTTTSTQRQRAERASGDTEHPSTSARLSGPTQQPAPRRRRKQATPQSRELKFIKEVLRLQNHTQPLIPRLAFSRLVRELMLALADGSWRITREALEAMQETSELYITQRLQDAYLLTLHRGRVTLSVKDLELINFLRNVDKV